MQIATTQRDGALEAVATGRLDESWADHLAAALDEVVRDGHHHILLNMAAVTYLSSAGIRVLVRMYRDLKSINGSFAVTDPSPAVRTILDMTRLSPLLLAGAGPAVEAAEAPRAPEPAIRTANGSLQVVDTAPPATLRCRIAGDATRFEQGGYSAADMTSIRFAGDSFGFGVGAFGPTFDECRERFGEFLVAAGAAAYLPTDGASAPDYLVAAGSLAPEVGVLYGVRCEGPFACQARFEAERSARDMGLTEVVAACMDAAKADTVGIAMIAETSGLVGAALRRSPAMERAAAASPFSHPEIRGWLTFTAEPAHAGCTCLIAGVASRDDGAPPRLGSLLRPMAGRDSGIRGHFHAVAFPYRPIQKGRLDLSSVARTLFEAHGPAGLLHLLCDSREAAGAGESRFVRGACWIGPIGEVAAV